MCLNIDEKLTEQVRKRLVKAGDKGIRRWVVDSEAAVRHRPLPTRIASGARVPEVVMPRAP